jgi:hypothetical protein
MLYKQNFGLINVGQYCLKKYEEKFLFVCLLDMTIVNVLGQFCYQICHKNKIPRISELMLSLLTSTGGGFQKAIYALRFRLALCAHLF